jgi:hypothetical protein
VILVDAGPLAALVDADDQHHRECTAALAQVADALGTVWPVVSEVMYLLSDLPVGQAAVWEMLGSGTVQLLPLTSEDIPRLRALMQKYGDLPMDLADAALIRVAEREGIRTIFTVDRKDFSVYRLHGRVRPTLIP